MNYNTRQKYMIIKVFLSKSIGLKHLKILEVLFWLRASSSDEELGENV